MKLSDQGADPISIKTALQEALWSLDKISVLRIVETYVSVTSDKQAYKVAMTFVSPPDQESKHLLGN